jgi:hypothetical protein
MAILAMISTSLCRGKRVSLISRAEDLRHVDPNWHFVCGIHWRESLRSLQEQTEHIENFQE